MTDLFPSLTLHLMPMVSEPTPTPELFSMGDRVRVIALPPYVKTAEPMPMLRPPNVLHMGEEGIILDRRPGGYWGVRFSQGAFLLDPQYLERVTDAPAS